MTSSSPRCSDSTTRCATSPTLFDEVMQLLTAHRDQLETLTAALLDAETLDAVAAYTAAGTTRATFPVAAAAPSPIG